MLEFCNPLSGGSAWDPHDPSQPTAVQWFPARASVPALKRLAAGCGGYSINEVLLACLAGAMRGWTPLAPPTALMWVTLSSPAHMYYPPDHPQAPCPHGMSNHDLAFVYLRLPTHLAPLEARLESVREQGRALLSSPQALLSNLGARLAGALPEALALPLLARFGSRGSVSVSNVPGPQFPVALGGVPIDTLCFWVPPQAGPSLFVNIISYNGVVTVAMIGPANLFSGFSVQDAFEAQIEELEALSCSRGSTENKKEK